MNKEVTCFSMEVWCFIGPLLGGGWIEGIGEVDGTGSTWTVVLVTLTDLEVAWCRLAFFSISLSVSMNIRKISQSPKFIFRTLFSSSRLQL